MRQLRSGYVFFIVYMVEEAISFRQNPNLCGSDFSLSRAVLVGRFFDFMNSFVIRNSLTGLKVPLTADLGGSKGGLTRLRTNYILPVKRNGLKI